MTHSPSNILFYTTLTISLIFLKFWCFKESDIKFAEEALEKKEGSNYCSIGGLITDSCCDYQKVDEINADVSPTLHELLKTPFFSHYKINLQKVCPYWNSNDLCSKVDCTVTTLEKEDVPEPWQSTENLGSLDFGLGNLNLKKFERCTYTNKDFCVLEDEESTDGVFVNLLKNPERFTGYAGDSAARVWKAIYEENCFGFLQDPESTPFLLTPDSLNSLCTEKRVFYRVLSGLHASISTHICDKYFNATSSKWEQNLNCFISRVGSHPERLENLYFNYVLLLRAVTKVSKYLENHSYCSTEPEQDTHIKALLKQLGTKAKACPETFDEKLLFKGKDAILLKDQFKMHFRNISQVMDCIGCQKCRLWGKIQTGGIGTALKILFSYESKSLDPKRNPNLFQKTEIVSLLNTFGRISESIEAVEKFRKLYKAQQNQSTFKLSQNSFRLFFKGIMTKIFIIADHYREIFYRQTQLFIANISKWFDTLCEILPGLKIYRKLVSKAFFPLGFIAV